MMDLEVGVSLNMFVLLSSVNTKEISLSLFLLFYHEFGYFNWLLETWCH